MPISSKDVTDEFARIAFEGRATTVNEPGSVDAFETQFRMLPSRQSDPSATFAPAVPFDSADQLTAELRRLRAHYKPFFRRYAPRSPVRRPRVKLRHFQWRQATANDLAGIDDVNGGQGTWKSVTVPHYGPPLGKAVTYYRATFQLGESMLALPYTCICFKGVDYIAKIFINGQYVGMHEGFFAPFEFDITACRRAGENVIVVRVENDAVCMSNGSWGAPHLQGDKIYAATGLGYDESELGWHHCPPGMGIWQEVYIESRHDLFIEDIFVRPRIEDSSAEAWINLHNCSSLPQDARLTLSLDGENFSDTVFHDRLHTCKGIGAGITFLRIPIEIPQYRRWSPDEPWLYRLQVKVIGADGTATDASSKCFGMRTFEMKAHKGMKGCLFLNGNPVRLRGANAMGHLQRAVMSGSWTRLRDDLLLFKAANLNFVRMTQAPVQSAVYDFCDRIGLMTQTDLPLFAYLRKNQFCEAIRQSQEMERLVRAHPCNVINSLMNEANAANAVSDRRHLSRDELEDFFDAATRAMRLANPDRVVKALDGDYDPPGPGLPDHHCYTTWYNGHGIELGRLHKGHWMDTPSDWMCGCGEYGAEGLDNIATMLLRYPAKWLPADGNPDSEWSPAAIAMAQTAKMHGHWFEQQKTMREWIDASQVHQAWAVGWVAGALRRNRRIATCAVHLLIDAWPGGWMKALVDVERSPKPAFFMLRDLMKPLMVQWRTDRQTCFAGDEIPLEAWICHDGPREIGDLHLHYQVEFEGTLLFSQRVPVVAPACDSVCAGVFNFKMPGVESPASVIVRGALIDSAGQVLADTVTSVQVWPREIMPIDTQVVIVGNINGPAVRLLRELGLSAVNRRPDSTDKVIVIDDISAYMQHRQQIDDAVEQGAVATILTLEPGKHACCDGSLDVVPMDTQAPFFASRNIGHPAVRQLGGNDFRLWYDAACDRITPIAEQCFAGNGLDPILTTVHRLANGEMTQFSVAAEARCGLGKLRFNAVSLQGRVTHNPAAKVFALQLLGIGGTCDPQ